MISNWMTLPTLLTQKIDNRNVRISFALFVDTNHTPISGLKTGLDTLNYCTSAFWPFAAIRSVRSPSELVMKMMFN